MAFMDSETKTVLVTGGTGFIGKALCKQLVNSGFKVYVFTRKQKYLSQTNGSAISYTNTLNQLSNIKIDIIINLAGETISKRWSKTVKEKIYTSRILTTRHLIDYIRSQQNRPKLLISGSAVGYYGTHSQTPFDEESDMSSSAKGFAHSLCKAWEDEAQQAKALGVRVVLLRMGPVLAKDGGILSKLLPSFYLGLGSQIGDGKQWLSWIDREDLINLILFIISHTQIQGPINATAPTPVSNQDFSLTLAKAIQRPCLLKMPACFLKLLFGKMAEEIMLEGQKVLPQKALNYGFQFSYPRLEQSLSKILQS